MGNKGCRQSKANDFLEANFIGSLYCHVLCESLTCTAGYCDVIIFQTLIKNYHIKEFLKPFFDFIVRIFWELFQVQRYSVRSHWLLPDENP